jgi:thiamine phosphate synthase YjbQ (UPF0047 family)
LIHQFGFKNKNILDLKDHNVYTSHNILQKLKKMISKSKSGDTLLMFYIRHRGTYVPINDENKPEISKYYTYCSKDTIIEGSQLVYIMDTVPHDRSLTIILDFCHTGTN